MTISESAGNYIWVKYTLVLSLGTDQPGRQQAGLFLICQSEACRHAVGLLCSGSELHQVSGFVTPLYLPTNWRWGILSKYTHTLHCMHGK